MENYKCCPLLRPHAMSEAHEALTDFLAQHPRMLGVLFTTALLLSSAGAAAARGGIYSTGGP